MLRGLYTVSTVLEQNNRAINVMSNNLANIHSTGYKRDIAQYEEFNSVLLSKVNGNAHMSPSGKLKVNVSKTKETQILDTNLGFFRVEAPGGLSHNTSIELRAGKDGLLRTVYRNGNHKIIEDAGYVVMGQKGPIKVDDKTFDIDEQGRVSVEGNIVDTLVFSQPKDIIGTLSGGIKFNRAVSIFEQGDLQRTENAFDFALNDKGFFTIMTPQGVRYTRNGQFKINAEKALVTNEGFAVMGVNGPIKLNNDSINITKYGEIIQDGLFIDKFKLINPSNVERLKKVGTAMFRFDGEMKEQAYDGEVVQGFLERSNVDSLKEMIQIMETYRSYESAQRVVRSYDDTLGKAVNEVARL